MQNDDLKGTEYQGFIAESLKCMKPHLEDKGVIYLFYADANTVEVRTAMRDTGWHISSGCIWVKNCPVSGYGNYNYAHECVLYAWKEGSTHEWYALSQGSTVWNCDRPHSTLFHSVSKPLALLEIPIRNSSIRGQIVLDPFLGTGSTLIICDQLERVCCGIELEEKYVDLIISRYLLYKDFDTSLVRLERGGEIMNLEDAEHGGSLVSMAKRLRSRGCMRDA